MENITITLGHVGKLENPLAPFLPIFPEKEEVDEKPALESLRAMEENLKYAPILAEIERQMQGENTVCAFTGRPFVDPSDEDVEERSRDMKSKQVEVERKGREEKSLRSAASRLPIAQSR